MPQGSIRRNTSTDVKNMTTVTLNVNQWAEEQFGQCVLGDRRRTKRLVRYAAQAAADPSSSTPKQTESWKDCKAAYHLIDNGDVNFAAITAPHYAATRARTEGTWLVISDTTETHFPGGHVQGLGPTGDGGGRGFLLHSALMVRANGQEIAGLAAQVIRYRRKVKKEISGAKRLRRKDRESVIWGQVVDQIGAAPQGVRWIHVFDRGGDQFELYCRISRTQAGWVGRAAQLKRKIRAPQGTEMKLSAYLEQLPLAGAYTLELPANMGQPAREATMEVRFGPVIMPRPKHASAWVKESGIRDISMWVVEAREINPPKGVQPARWVLLTSEPVESFNAAWTVLEYYEKRWLVEEYHKALKTGCRLEARQYETAKRLEAITGVLSILAVRLLQLKMVARDDPQRPANEVVPKKWIVMLQCLRKRTPTTAWTVREFYREMAKLGGFLGRKSDGEPGWLTLWRGFEKLHLCLRGAESYQKKCG
jgi:Transposase DNA-binding/Transposase Tn5 dimerisation domain